MRNSSPVEHTVVWRGRDGAIGRGSLRLAGSELVLRGSGGDGAVVRRRIPLDEILSVRIGRNRSERIEGARSVILELRAGGSVAVAPLGTGEVIELAELVAELTSNEAKESERVALVVPLRKGAAERARELAAAGPPFDLDRAGLDRHHVFVTEREALFFFEGASAREILDQLVRHPRVLRAAARWSDCLAGPPRLAEESFAWRRDT